MRIFATLAAVVALTGCGSPSAGAGDDLTAEDLEAFFRKHTVDGNEAVAIKPRFTVPAPGVAYLGTIHGYPNNRGVCEDLIAPYNEDPSLTVIPGGSYFCEVLR